MTNKNPYGDTNPTTFVDEAKTKAESESIPGMWNMLIGLSISAVALGFCAWAVFIITSTAFSAQKLSRGVDDLQKKVLDSESFKRKLRILYAKELIKERRQNDDIK